MADHSNSKIGTDEDLRLVLESLNSDNAEIDQAFLDQLKRDSRDAFETAHSLNSNEPPLVVSSHQIEAKNHPMRTTALVTTIAFVLSMCWLVTTPQSEASVLKLGDVLSEVDETNSLQLRVTRNEESADVWIKDQSAIRWEESPHSYQVARGAKLWEVTAVGENEPYVSRTSSNPWRGESGNIDLLALMGINAQSSHELLEAKPDGMAKYSGIDCLVYRELVQTDHEPVRLNFYVSQQDKELIAVTARPKGARRTGPPLVELAFVAKNFPLDDGQFRIPVNLPEENRIGKVIDSQGMVLLRPSASSRWTPLVGHILLQPNDWLRTDVRGANALTVELASGVKLIAGPGTQLEVISGESVRVLSGTVQVQYPKSSTTPISLTGKKEQALTINKPGKVIYRVDPDHGLVLVQKKPVWLKSYEGSSAEDSIGSLIVEIDGRATPLTVGEHHVTVEIRDQIARTTIEETFVNHTNRRMEGQFHFPLPQDASISGFGMWIGGELIEADVVEKQRAREIYETILREKRDPGLLEWTGGNIFKARVFPIEAHSEKRVKIVYTQVLPLQDNRFRYSYGLKSEMLQTNPLRELNIRCYINSTVPLSAAKSTSHTCRTQLTDHSAELEFTAQEYSPTKDFEVVCDVSQRENDVVMIPHRRGDDGYFLLELMPPGEDGDWQRQTIGEGDPLELILLCDTSNSMSSSMRENQHKFVTSILNSLGEKDRFALATTDVKTNWVIDRFSEPTRENIRRVEKSLADRVSLGWTDLDEAFQAVLKKATPETQIIYIGDGIYTTAQTDPVKFVNRLKQQFQQKYSNKKSKPTLHAVSVGTAFESLVLKGIAALGGGSQRQIAGEISPQQAARDLLQEMTRPGLKDIDVQFEGIRVAAVYPEELPNIPTGTQQILVGRYLPTGKDQKGKVIVTGILDGKKVKYVALVNLTDAEQGNSFIPRLWARGHLEHLLQQGSSPGIQDQVIALSEEFHIITPYTSLLVLESDADRERFGVKRRFGMRDGEQFFADGRSNANYELKQQQMKNAGNWRIGLRNQVFSEFANLGRDAKLFQNLQNISTQFETLSKDKLRLGVEPAVIISNQSTSVRFDNYFLGDQVQFLPQSGPVAAEEFSFYVQIGRRSESAARGGNHWYFSNGLSDELSSYDSNGVINNFSRWGIDSSGNDAKPADISNLNTLKDGETLQFFDDSENLLSYDSDFDGLSIHKREVGFELSSLEAQKKLPALSHSSIYDYRTRLESELRQLPMDEGVRFNVGSPKSRGISTKDLGKRLYATPGQNSLTGLGSIYDPSSQSFRRRSESNNSLSWVRQLFPQIPSPNLPVEQSEENSDWTEEAIELSKSLLIDDQLRALNGGLKVFREMKSWSDDHDRLVAANSSIEVWSPEKWLTVNTSQGQNAIVNWRYSNQRGIYSESFMLGQSRKLVSNEPSSISLQLPEAVLRPLHETMRTYHARTEIIDEGRTKLILFAPKHTTEFHYLIDTEKNAITRQETLSESKVIATTEYQNFVQVAKHWLPSSIVSTRPSFPDEQTYTITLKYQELSKQEFDQEWNAQLSKRDHVFVLEHPLPTVEESLNKNQSDEATLQHHFILLMHYCSDQNWDDAFEHLRKLKEKEDTYPGIRWIRIAVEIAARRNEDARQRIVDFIKNWSAGKVAGVPELRRGDQFLVTHLLSTLYPIIGWEAYASVLQQVRLFYERQAEKAVAMLDWQQRWIQALNALKQHEEKIALHKEMAEQYPGNPSLQIAYGNSLLASHRPIEAEEFLLNRIALGDHWKHYELNQIRNRYAELLESSFEYDELLEFLTGWMEQETGESRVYERYLAALVFADQVDKAEKTVKEWLLLAENEEKLDSIQTGKIKAATSFAFGKGHHLYRNRGMDRKWLPELYHTAKACLQSNERISLATAITSDRYFYQSDEGDRLRGDILQWLLTDVHELSIERLRTYIKILQLGRLLIGEAEDLEIRQVTSEEWQQISESILTRWKEADEAYSRHQLSEILLSIYSSKLKEKHLPFLRLLVEEGVENYRPSYRMNLFNSLLSQTWSAENEAEAFQLWRTLSNAESKSLQVAELVPHLYRLVDAMLKNRISHEMTNAQYQGEQNEFTRTEQQQRQEKIIQTAHAELAARLETIADSLEESHPELLPWVLMEKINLDIALNRNRPQVIKQCWKIIGEKFRQSEFNDDISGKDFISTVNENFLRQRALYTLIYLATLDQESEKLRDRLIQYVDSAIQILLERSQKSLTKQDNSDKVITDLSSNWKRLKFQLLILFERNEQLTTTLEAWINSDHSDAMWQHALAMLLAEQGDLERAIRIFEELEEEKKLAAGDYVSLANWYLVLDQKEKHQSSRIKTLMRQGENQLSNYLNNIASQVRNGHELHELDEQAFLVLQALFQKTNRPEKYYYTIQNLYTATRDFRTLEIVPDSILGRTQSRVYNSLNQFRYSILSEVRKEATADEMLEQIQKSRKEIQAGKVPRGADANQQSKALDLRALDLLETLIEAKSGQVLNQPGPHIAKAFAALRRAFEHDWQKNEPVAYAKYLEQIGELTASANRQQFQPLIDLILDQFRTLRERAEIGSADKVRIVISTTSFLSNSLGERQEGLLLLEAALNEFAAQHDGSIPYLAHNFVTTYSSFLQKSGAYDKAENYVIRHLKLLDNESQKWTYQDHLNRLYEQAFRNDAQVSLGEGAELFDNLIDHLTEQAETPDRNRRHNVLVQIGNLFSYAIGDKTKGPADEKEQLLQFTRKTFPRLIQANLNSPTSLVNHFASVLHSRISALEALDFILTHYENYPPNLSYTNRSPWSQHAWQMARYRSEAALNKQDPERIKQLEKRLLPIVLAHLREELINQTYENRTFYHDDQSYFWSEMTDEFYQETQQVIKEFSNSPRTLFYSANYLYEGLSRYQAAINVLENVRERGLLDDASEHKLVMLMHEQKMYKRSIPMLVDLLKGSPQYMTLRVQLLRAYFYTEQIEKLNDLLTDTIEIFHEDGLWTENNIVSLARICVEIGEFNKGTSYFEEAISLHQQSQPNRGIGGRTLSQYYQELAEAYGKLSQTSKAVDAAAAAVVSWGPEYEQRQEAVQQLYRVANSEKNFDQFLREWNQKSEKTGQDSSLIRKAIANRFMQKEKYQEASEQYQIALELSPFDREIHSQLLSIYDQLNDHDRVIRQLITQIDSDRHNLDLYIDLANRTVDDPGLAERAATSIVESAPNEAESHTALAEYREKQDRWADAINHWQRASELRKLEPDGLLGLANAQIQAKQWQPATRTLEKLRKTEWPSRFNTIDKEIRNLKSKIPQ